MILSNPPRDRDVLEFVQMWLKLFGMDATWQVGVRVNGAESECTDADCVDDLAFTKVDAGYYHATIEINAYKFLPDTDVDKVVLHEFTHIPLWTLSMCAEAGSGDMSDVVTAQIEEVTEIFARVMIGIFRRAVDKEAGGRKRKRGR